MVCLRNICINTLHKGDNDDDNNNNNNNNNRLRKNVLTSADLFAETEGFLTAIQDQLTLTRNYNKFILKKLCRKYGKESETIQHITAACEQLAPTEYVKRYDGLAKVIHQKLAEAADLIVDKSPYFKYTPASVL